MVKIEPFNTSLASSIIRQLASPRSLFSTPWNQGNNKTPINAISGKTYCSISLIPLLVATVEHQYVDPRWATLTEVQNEGWHIRNGACPTQLFGIHSPLHPQDHIQELYSETRLINQAGKETRLNHSLIKHPYVFNAQDLEGIPEFSSQDTLSSDPLEEAQAIIKALKVDIFHGALNTAYYTTTQDVIYLPNRDQFASIENYYSTVLHKLSHATGHPSRLNRSITQSTFGTESYALEELRAEIASLMLCAYTGIPYDATRHIPFIPSWIESLSKNHQELFAACRDADAITEYIISRRVTMNTIAQQITDPEHKAISQASTSISEKQAI